MKYEDTLRLTGVTTMPGFDEIASGYGYNLRSLKDVLTKQAREIENLTDSLNGFGGLPYWIHLNKDVWRKETYEEKLRFFLASYPESRGDDGKQVHRSCLLDHIPKNIGDGYYHVKGHSRTQSDNNSIEILEEHSPIPYAVGKALEDLWNQPGTSMFMPRR